MSRTARPQALETRRVRVRRESSGPGPEATDNWPRTKRVLPWSLAGFIAMLWLLPFDSISLPVSLPLGAKLDRPLLMVIVALWVLSLATARGSGKVRLSPIHYAFAGFILIAIISLVMGADMTVRLGEFELGVRKLALLLSYFALFVVVASSVRPGEVRNYMLLMCGLAALMAIGTLWEYRSGVNVFFEWTGKLVPVELPIELGNVDSLGRKSVIGPTIHPLAPAMMMACAIPYALISMYENPDMRRKVAWGVAAGLMFAAALATGRKTSIVAPVSALLVLIAFRPRILRQLVPAAIGLVVIVHLAAPGALGGVSEKLMPQNFFAANSTVDRQSDYSAIRPDVIDHPLLGRGYETYDQKKYRILDNQYLTTVIGTGVLGILSYLSIFAAIFLVAHRVARNGRSEAAAIAVAIAAASVALVVGSGLFDMLALAQIPYMFCFLAGFVAVLSWDLPAKRRPLAAPGRVPIGPDPGPVPDRRWPLPAAR